MKSITNKEKLAFINDFISDNNKKILIYDCLLNTLMTENELPEGYYIEDQFVCFEGTGERSNHLFLICQK